MIQSGKIEVPKECIGCGDVTTEFWDDKEMLCNKCDDRLHYPEGVVCEEIEKFPKIRTFEHCNQTHIISNLEIYNICPVCKEKCGKHHSLGGPDTIWDVLVTAERWLRNK